MKKKMLVLVAAAIVAVGAAWNLSQANESNALSDLTLANVEALASETGLGGGDCLRSCSGDWCVRIEYPDGNVEVRFYCN